MLARAVRVLFGVVVTEYQRALRSRALLDFSDVLQRAVDLLRQMDEFAQSRYRLESRYHHVLVDEFQDTSRSQWELISLLVQSWGEGGGLVAEAPLPPTIFVVGDHKQSIYRFRDADVATFREATDEIAGLRVGGDVRRSISHSFRAVPGLLGFVNDLFAEIGSGGSGRDGFRFEVRDRFPVEQLAPAEATGDALGVIAAQDLETRAAAVAAEIAALLGDGQVRQKGGAGTRAVRPQDVAILFRTRESHREFEDALGRRGIPTHVYKGMGFFDADEIKDVRALVRFLANPSSELRVAALLRSRLVGVSDPGLLALAGALSPALVGPDLPAGAASLADDDRSALTLARRGVREWMGLIDRLPPAEVLDRVLSDAAYAFELRGLQAAQAQASLKKMRALVRRIQNRGYATMARVANQIDRLSTGMANAVVEAVDAVALMTVHAAKGFEFPIVFLVDLGRGTRTYQPPVRVIPDRGDGRPAVAVWPYRDEAAEAERQRDVEETKRLLYVAATRPRSPVPVHGRGGRRSEVQPGQLRKRAAGVLPGAVRAGRRGAGGPARGVAGPQRGAAQPAGVRVGVRGAPALGRGAGGQGRVTARPACAVGLAAAGRTGACDRVGSAPRPGRAGPGGVGKSSDRPALPRSAATVRGRAGCAGGARAREPRAGGRARARGGGGGRSRTGGGAPVRAIRRQRQERSAPRPRAALGGAVRAAGSGRAAAGRRTGGCAARHDRLPHARCGRPDHRARVQNGTPARRAHAAARRVRRRRAGHVPGGRGRRPARLRLTAPQAWVVVEALGPAPGVRLGFFLRLADEDHRAGGLRVVADGQPSHPVASAQLAVHLVLRVGCAHQKVAPILYQSARPAPRPALGPPFSRRLDNHQG